MIPFNKPAVIGDEVDYVNELINNREKFSGDGLFTKKCSALIEDLYDVKKVLLTTSCTHALEMAAILLDIKEGDEVIMPSYTFVSTANAFVLRGAKIVFVDIRSDTMNIDETKIEQAITNKTKVIVPVHYAGVSCEMDTIMEIAEKYSLFVVEDAAQGVNSFYKEQALGTIGHLGCYSFHETKNYNCGEGGALLINEARFIERAEIIREKGTNRSKFFRGHVDKYGWVDIGSSYLPSEFNAAFLYGQLRNVTLINDDRLSSWNLYYESLKPLADNKVLELPTVSEFCGHNAHMFYIKVKNLEERSNLIEHLKTKEIGAVFHYIPLHSSEAGKKYGTFIGTDLATTVESERLLRLPLYYDITKEEVLNIVKEIKAYYSVENRGDQIERNYSSRR
ncbi:dTDP-4-amino-4,6-dideoxygalactose transaminase [Metasolibacillus meyeri]|uniref:dTDP-4-amino-4,6-dideoxygalactose transaminase n=1 Tax=Metasolibacillus meyeri TaxID=1071052 RepID=UPI000D2FA5DC|nr:dTDP-4-amino-4,6-dideoxygalactose transaminase [Metasolibacillus meyeri]